MTLPKSTQRVLQLIMLGNTNSRDLSLAFDRTPSGRPCWTSMVEHLKRLERAGLIRREPWRRGVRRPVTLTRKAFFCSDFADDPHWSDR